MRVGILPDPVLFERPGALRTQVLETVDALGRLGVETITLAGTSVPGAERCALVHLFGAARGNARLLDELPPQVPVVLSPRVSPAWTSVNGTRARVADRVLGNRTSWDFDTGYAQIRRALGRASLVVAACEGELRALQRAFLVPPKRTCVIGNGAGPRFFSADPAPFRERWRIAGRFALMVGQISPWHGQIDVAHALAGLALPLVVIGPVHERDAAYLQALRTLRSVVCIEPLAHADPLLASACAAASVLVLPAHGAAMPISAIEALACGTPVVASWPLGEWAGTPGLIEVPAGDQLALAHAVSELLAHPPPRAQVTAGVAGHTWDNAARQLMERYRMLIGELP
jgi:glycosyltransferase involved in cell wall biosynthesis